MPQNWPVLVVPLDVAGTGYAVDPATFSPMFQGIAEADAQAHWLFGADNPYMADMIAGSLMTPRLSTRLIAGGSGYSSAPDATRTGKGQTIAQALATTIAIGAVNALNEIDPGSEDANAAGTINLSGGGGTGAATFAGLSPAPTQNVGFLSIADATANNVNGYQTPIDIKRDQTVCCVVKRKTLANTTLIVGWWPPTAALTPCWMVQIAAGGYTAYSRSAAGNFAGDGQVVTPPAGSVGDWLFLAASHDAGGNREIIWGNGSTYSQAGALDVANVRHRIGIGSSFSTYTGSLDCAELMVFSTKRTPAQVANIYNRTKIRLLARGITVV